ncbi:hypothetical protein GUJ93_ZPchr0002g22942 [Zizania palustris]|uniref:Uncharacterized protein n=1 Tax=Zizania palustris TaxID=103762 RepID=A0A8J5VCJ8_ZIZPA|nr:hypothetical protein GUJ93_ZPchr0002g22942 [Zizania palustris]
MVAGGSPTLSLHALPLAAAATALAAAVPKPQAVANPSNTGSISCKASPSLYGIFPYTGLKFYFYEKMKIQVPEEHRKDIIAKLGCGSISGLLGQTVTYPLNVVRQQMQAFSRSNLENGKGTFGSLIVIVKHQGWRQLFSGLSINYMKVWFCKFGKVHRVMDSVTPIKRLMYMILL